MVKYFLKTQLFENTFFFEHINFGFLREKMTFYFEISLKKGFLEKHFLKKKLYFFFERLRFLKEKEEKDFEKHFLRIACKEIVLPKNFFYSNIIDKNSKRATIIKCRKINCKESKGLK